MQCNIKAQRLAAKLNQELGPSIMSYLSDPEVLEVGVYNNCKVWLRHKIKGFQDTFETLSPTAIYQLICTIAHYQGLVINDQNPIIETELPYSTYRFSGILPPIVVTGAFTIRKPSPITYTINEYLKSDMITSNQIAFIREAISSSSSIIIAGGPGTGKTTFANALIAEMIRIGNSNDRYVVIEDTRELKCEAPNTLSLKTSDYISYDKLLVATLRHSPDRIILGECRGPEMFTLLKAWNTGTKGGIATIHANNTESALIRIQDLANESGSYVSPHLISESIDVVIVMECDGKDKRKVTEIIKVCGYKEGQYVIKRC